MQQEQMFPDEFPNTEGAVVDVLPDKPTGLDFQSTQKALLPYKSKVEEMLKLANDIQVKDAESSQAATDLGKGAKVLAKELTRAAKAYMEEPEKYVKNVRGLMKMLTDPLDQVERVTKNKIGTWMASVELERRKQEELAKRAAQELQEKINEEAKAAGVEAPQIETKVAIPKKQTVTRTASGASASVRMDWKGIIENEALVPREYCSADQKKINEAVNGGVREIPGVIIKQVPVTSFR